MKFGSRLFVINSILERVRDDNISVLVFGSGKYLKLVENMFFHVAELYFPGHVLMLQEKPSFRAYFHGGGSVSLTDITEGNTRGGRHLEDTSGYDFFLIVEDNRGDLVDEIANIIIPLMERRPSSELLILGDIDES